MQSRTIDKLERAGRFVAAEQLRKKQVKAARRNNKKASSEEVAGIITSKIKEAISQVLADNDLSTAIFYVEKIISNSLNTLRSELNTALQEVLESAEA